MEIKELRIGNPVEYKDYGKSILMSINANGFCKVTPLNFVGEIGCTIDELKPIPITPELLYQLGFKDRSEHRGDGAIFDLENKDWKRSFCVAKSYNKDGFTHLGTDRVNILWLHQLENIFFAMVGLELSSAVAENI